MSTAVNLSPSNAGPISIASANPLLSVCLSSPPSLDAHLFLALNILNKPNSPTPAIINLWMV